MNVAWLFVPDRQVWLSEKLLIYWDFSTHTSLGFTENGLKKKIYSECQFSTKNRKLRLQSYRLAKIGQQKTGKMFPDP